MTRDKLWARILLHAEHGDEERGRACRLILAIARAARAGSDCAAIDVTMAVLAWHEGGETSLDQEDIIYLLGMALLEHIDGE